MAGVRGITLLLKRQLPVLNQEHEEEDLCEKERVKWINHIQSPTGFFP